MYCLLLSFALCGLSTHNFIAPCTMTIKFHFILFLNLIGNIGLDSKLKLAFDLHTLGVSNRSRVLFLLGFI